MSNCPSTGSRSTSWTSRARTIHPDGSIVNFEGKPFEKTIVKASGYKYLAKTFTLPDVHPGSIIEYRYREQSDPHYYVDESWTITGHLYTRDAHFVIRPDPSSTFPLPYRQHGLPAGADSGEANQRHIHDGRP